MTLAYLRLGSSSGIVSIIYFLSTAFVIYIMVSIFKIIALVVTTL